MSMKAAREVAVALLIGSATLVALQAFGGWIWRTPDAVGVFAFLLFAYIFGRWIHGAAIGAKP